MEGEIGFLNVSYDVEESFAIYQVNGDSQDMIRCLPDKIKDVLTVTQLENLEAGEWIMMIDGEIKNIGMTHPFKIDIEE